MSSGFNQKILVCIVILSALIGTFGVVSAVQVYSSSTLSQHSDLLTNSLEPNGDGKLSVIVHYKNPPSIIDDIYIYARSGDVKQRYNGISAIACELPPSVIEKLQTDPAVTFIEMDGTVHAFDIDPNIQTVGWGVYAVGATNVQSMGKSGQGVKVGIIDTGIDYTHPDLAANYVGGYDFVNRDSDPLDDHGHGTHVAGIIGALNNNIGTLGVAPQVSLYSIKVLDKHGGGSISDVISGIHYCVDNDIDVVCMSLGSRQNSPALQEACTYANNHGVVLVAAAGNNGDGNIGTTEVAYPAAYDTTIAVGAVDENNRPATWSNSGPYVSVCAPGVDIVSTLPLTGTNYYSESGYGALSGTSMAAPHVVGVVAQLIQAHPEYNANEIKYAIERSANSEDVGHNHVSGYGLVSAGSAIQYVMPTDGSGPSPPGGVIGNPIGSIYWEYGGETIDDWWRVGSITNDTKYAVGAGEGFGSGLEANQKALERYVYFPGTQTVLKFWGQARRGGEPSDWDYILLIDGVRVASFANSIDKWTEYSVPVAGFSEGVHKITFIAEWQGEYGRYDQFVGLMVDSVRLYADETLPFAQVASAALLETMDIRSTYITHEVLPLGDNGSVSTSATGEYFICGYDPIEVGFTQTGWSNYVNGPNKYAISNAYGYSGAYKIAGAVSTKGLGRTMVRTNNNRDKDSEPESAYKPYEFPSGNSNNPGDQPHKITKVDMLWYGSWDGHIAGGVYVDSGFGFGDYGTKVAGFGPDEGAPNGQWTRSTMYTPYYSGLYIIHVNSMSYSDPNAVVAFDEVVFYADKIDPDFTVDVDEGTYPCTVEFTRNPTDKMGETPKLGPAQVYQNYIKGQRWDFGDGTSSNARSPTHTYTSPGLFDVEYSLNYFYGDQVVSHEKMDIINVTTPGAVVFDCNFTGNPVSGKSPLEVEFTGTCAGAGEIIYVWEFGDGYTGYGETVKHTYITYGSNQTYSVALMTQNDVGTGTCTRASYIEVEGSGSVSAGGGSYIPHQVRLLVVDQFGKPLQNVSINASAEQTTGSWGWLTSWFGIPSDVDVQNTVMSGTTGSNGALIFSMVETVKYRLDIVAPATRTRDEIKTTVFLYPLESEHMITLIPDRELSSGEALDVELWTKSIDSDTVRVGVTYSDVTLNTTLLQFTVSQMNVAEDGSISYSTLHTDTRANPSGKVTLSYDFDYMGGETLVWGYKVDHAIYGKNIEKSQYISIKSLRPLIDFAPWVPMDIYNWIAIVLLICMAAMFSFYSLKFGVVMVPIFGGLLKFWNYLDCPWTIVSIAIALGILIYIRIAESESDT